jgi:hypothetical protein
MPRLAFTEHAIDRFIARFAPGLDRVTARRQLEDAVVSKVKTKTVLGQAQWRLDVRDDLSVVAVTKQDRGSTELVVVTILPTMDTWLQDSLDEETRLSLERIEEENHLSTRVHETRAKGGMTASLMKSLDASEEKSAKKQIKAHVNATESAIEKYRESVTDVVLRAQRQRTAAEVVKNSVPLARLKTIRIVADRLATRNALRAAVRALREHGDDTTLREIEAIDSFFITDEFLAQPSNPHSADDVLDTALKLLEAREQNP